MAFHKLQKHHQYNLKKLRDYMIKTYSTQRYSARFSMAEFSMSLDDEEVYTPLQTPECGTCCCLAGHGPAAGINPTVPDITWHDYIKNNFGIVEGIDIGWEFLFSAEWSSDIQEAIERLNMYIGGFDPTLQYWDYTDYYTEDK